MDYNQGYPYGSSRSQPSCYGPYSYSHAPDTHHYAAPSAPYYYQHPPPPGTEHAAPPVRYSSAEASYYGADRMNPAAASAVAALTQLTGFAASMSASQRAMRHLVDPPHYPTATAQHPTAVGSIRTPMGGRRGGGNPSHGGGRGRGSSTYHHPIEHIGVTSPNGRGRGRGRGGKVSGRKLAIHAHDRPSTAEAQSGTTPAPAQIQEMEQLTTVNISRERALLVAWCDVCQVGCNNKEILEQHKNGKRHKKTVQRMQDMDRLHGKHGVPPAISATVAPACQVVGLPEASSDLAEGTGPSAAPHMVSPVGSSSHEGEDHKSLASENVIASVAEVPVSEATTVNRAQQHIVPPARAFAHSIKAHIQELHAAVVQAHQPVNEMKEGSDAPPCNATTEFAPPDVQSAGTSLFSNSSRNGPKRKITRPSHGEKKPKISEATRRRPARVREQPLVCTLCNVTCNTKAVFDIHLGGKKHLSRLKRSQHGDSVFGPLVLYIPPNQPVPQPVGAPEPIYYGLRSHDMVEQEAYLLGAMQYAFPVLPWTDQLSTAAVEGTQVTSDLTCAVQPIACAMDSTEKAGLSTEQVGNSGPVTVEADAKEVPPTG